MANYDHATIDDFRAASEDVELIPGLLRVALRSEWPIGCGYTLNDAWGIMAGAEPYIQAFEPFVVACESSAEHVCQIGNIAETTAHSMVLRLAHLAALSVSAAIYCGEADASLTIDEICDAESADGELRPDRFAAGWEAIQRWAAAHPLDDATAAKLAARIKRERMMLLVKYQPGELCPPMAIANGGQNPRTYIKKRQAEQVAKDKFHELWRIDNISEWARQIGCNRATVPKLNAWHEAVRRRNGWRKLAVKLRGIVDPAIIEALQTGDASVIGSLSESDRDRIDGMPDADREEVMSLLTESARDADFDKSATISNNQQF